MDRRFRTIASREGRNLEGFGMGGYGGDMAYFRRVSPWELAAPFARLPAGDRPSVRLVIGSRDETLPANDRFHERLDALGVAHDYTRVPGVGHDALALLTAMGDDYWALFRERFGRP